MPLDELNEALEPFRRYIELGDDNSSDSCKVIGVTVLGGGRAHITLGDIRRLARLAEELKGLQVQEVSPKTPYAIVTIANGT